MTPRVAIIQRTVPHYREALFAQVHAEAARVGLDVGVFSGPSPAVTAGRRFPHRVLRARHVGRGPGPSCWLHDLNALVAGSDVIVAPQDFACLNVPYLWMRRRRLCRTWIWWGHGYNHQRSSDVGLRRMGLEAVRRFLTRNGDGLITYTEAGARYWQRRGLDERRVSAYLNTIDVDGLRRAAGRIEDAALEARRLAYGLTGKRVLLFSGRLYAAKRVDFLLRTFARLRTRRRDVALLILGDGPARARLEALRDELRLADAHFLGERVDPSESGVYFRLADMLVIPGIVGLAIVHGFAFGLPLITTAHDEHSPEIDYLTEENGVATSPDETAYGRAIAELLESPERLAVMRAAAMRDGDRLRLDASVSRFVAAIVRLSGHRA